MARKVVSRSEPVKRVLTLRMLQWGVLAGVLASLALIVAQGTQEPLVLPSPEDQAAIREKDSPYSLASLHERLPPEAIQKIQRYLDFFSKVQHRRISDGLARSTRYLERYQETFRNKGVPEELAYLPLIESGFVTNAVSPAQAAGVWQFIEETGRRYNLKRTAYTDQRLDPFQSVGAAASLLKNLHGVFNDWELALAAYNAGANTVRWAKRVNTKAGKPLHFWALDLPDETTEYVPAFIAAMIIAKNPQAFGFKRIKFEPRITYDQIKVSPGMPLHDVAVHLEVDLEDVWDLNPNLIMGETPPGETPHLLRVPTGTRQVVHQKLARNTSGLKDWMLHRVHDSDSVEYLAYRFRSSPNKIMQVNDLNSDEELNLREFIIIPL